MGSGPHPGDKNPWARRVFPIIGSVVGSLFGPVGGLIGGAAGNAVGNSVATNQYPGINVAGPGGIPALFGDSKTSSSGGSGGTGMGSHLNPFSMFGGGGGGGSSGGGSSGLSSTGEISGLNQLAQQSNTQGNQLYDFGYGMMTGPAYNQWLAGATGQLTPSQQAMVDENLGQMNLGTEGTYGNLGSPGSTMETQDTNANRLRSMAEEANLEAQSEQLGAQGIQVGNQVVNQAGNYFGRAGTDLYQAGGLANEQQRILNAAISSLGNKSTGGGLTGASSGIKSVLDLFGSGAGGGGAGDLTGSFGDTGTVLGGSQLLDQGAFDTGSGGAGSLISDVFTAA